MMLLKSSILKPLAFMQEGKKLFPTFTQCQSFKSFSCPSNENFLFERLKLKKLAKKLFMIELVLKHS